MENAPFKVKRGALSAWAKNMLDLAHETTTTLMETYKILDETSTWSDMMRG